VWPCGGERICGKSHCFESGFSRFCASVGRSLSIFLLVLAASVSLSPAKAETRKLLRSPRPELTSNTWSQLRYIQAGQAVECKISMGVKRGEVLWTTMSKTTGLKAADDEICNWVKRTWRFSPDMSGTFSLPLVLHPRQALVSTPG
jgi:hypothetical protein